MTKPSRNFKLKPGQTDYTNIHWAPVINCVVKHKNKILLVQRSTEVNFYPGYWNGISGFLDDDKGLKEKVKEELREELGLLPKDIISIRLAEIFDRDDRKCKKTWIVHPVMVRVKTDKIVLDSEAKQYVWASIREAKELKLLPGFDIVLEKVSKLRQEK
jgi:ADP-ribose pyrophosphatase YjhB (NUDIX family)